MGCVTNGRWRLSMRRLSDTLRVGVNIIQVHPGLPQFDDHIQIGVRLRASF